MNTERLNNSENSSGFNVEYTKEEKRERRLGFGRKILNFVRGEAHEKEPSKEYLLTEHMPMPENRKARQYFEKLYGHWDETGAKMPREIGESLELFVKDKNTWFGVHRSDSINGREFENDAILQKIMAEGLKNAGDASSGSIRRNPSVSKTVSHCEDMFHTAMNLKGSYKGSTGAILVAIPSEYLDEDGDVLPGMEEKVYNTDKNGVSVIKPEYLMGFMQSLGEGTTMKFKTRDEILKASRAHLEETEE